jgi:hypothetical protein
MCLRPRMPTKTAESMIGYRINVIFVPVASQPLFQNLATLRHFQAIVPLKEKNF